MGKKYLNSLDHVPDYVPVSIDMLIDKTLHFSISDFVGLKTGKNENQLSDNSAKGLPAQFTGLCETGNLYNAKSTIATIISLKNNELGHYEKAIIELQFLFGLRISEVLNINYSAVSADGSIRIRGLKGSSDRQVYPVVYRNYWLTTKHNRTIFPSSYNRWYFYRLYRKKGIYHMFQNNGNQSVTHLARYSYIISLLKDGRNIPEIQQLIGHKSINSTIHYVRNIAK